MEMYRHLENTADAAEQALYTAGLKLAVPVGFTLPFRQAPARLTIVGFDLNTRGSAPPITPSRVTKIIHSGTVEGEKTAPMTPPQGNQSWGDAPLADIDTATKNLKAVIEAALALGTHPVGGTVVYMEYSGVKYGTLFNQKSFRTFPL